jgi:hypothetical protein
MLGVILAPFLFTFPPIASAADEVLLNGNLSKGSGGQPDNWRTEAWINEPAAVTFTWTKPPEGQPGELEVNAIKPDDARWMESLALKPGWYYFSAEIRTENVPAQNIGASISIMEDGAMSPDIKGTTNWTRVGFYIRVGSKGADVEVALRIGGFASLNSGKAFFRNASAIQVPAPPPNATPTYDLEEIRKAGEPKPIGSPLSLVLTYLALIAIAFAGWYMFALQPPKISRAELRRETRKGSPKKAARR